MNKASAIVLCLVLCSNTSFGISRKKSEEYIAGVIYAEALGQSDYAKGLVATTIWVRSKGNPSNFYNVCSIPKQFTRPQKNNDPDYKNCLALSKRMHSGKFRPLSIQRSNGVWIHPDHFYTNNYPTPFWARGKWYKKIGNFRFLQLGKFKTKK